MEPLCQNLALKGHCVSMMLLCHIISYQVSLGSGMGVAYTLQQVTAKDRAAHFSVEESLQMRSSDGYKCWFTQ